ncbi:MAG: ABC transporter ATP-binding protein [Acidobacteriota bacterium]|jgi:putative ABC transport system ATP-binding protein|nr:ABC transporter ATP-binding protein [Acidobacteriota bacterium]
MMPSDPVISVENLARVYTLGGQEVHALRQATFTVEKNEFLAVMGPSGSGKSTLMNLIGCLDTPTAGTYRLNGRLASSMTEDELAAVRNRDIGFVFQVFNLLSRTSALRNVELPLIYGGIKKKEREDKARRALDMVEMTARIHHRPSELSGGERQRVAIARALVNEPSLLLADEPTGNLDSRTGAEILKLFHKIHAAGNTIILVTHDHDVAAETQRIIYLRDGLIERDERKEL